MKSLERLLGSDLQMATAHNNRLKKQISQCVPANAMAHVLFARNESRTLRITVSSAAWAAKMRFYAAEIVRQSTGQQNEFDEVRVHVLPENRQTPLKRTSRRTSPSASDATTEALCQVAVQIEQSTDGQENPVRSGEGGSELGDALRRLASNLSTRR